ncbi:GNAT family N-acetyltransferase [Jeotgalibacillus campisalis]|uniref:Ribosomal-protein-alanine N-acetyltransferase n=1 Tax=Jeotgalibacillus campisalis TaxID=220754 RepID=A0A0C2W915_9BACL|nr:GNAT family protein [Jeotgalibacillus campisalis]KIL53071.1 ribosomal-protein-alanine N-acetyltransferase [Jeotgalibacillus campisalis]
MADAAKKFPDIETDNFRLREVTKNDAKDLFVYLSDEDVVNHMGLAPAKQVEDTLDEINWYKSIFQDGTGIRWGITRKNEGRVIGSCGFLNIAHSHSRAEIGFEVHKEYWGKGVAGEALQAVLGYGFDQLGFERIQALIEPENIASQKLVEKHGFKREGLLRHYEYTQGKFDDLYMFSLLKEEHKLN